jgi:protein tyrosine phosphatase (PTP) superfamily phosphohydrolase (DUF442 family)
MSVNQAYNFKEISDSVSSAGVLTEDQLKLLKSEGYHAVINLLPSESEYAIKNEASLVKDQDIIYEHIPVDFSSPTKENYLKFESKLKELSGKKVILHCAANYRVSAFYAIFAHFNLGWSKPKAMEHINSIWKLSDHPTWEIFVNNMLGQNNG